MMKQTMTKCDLAELHMISSAASVWHLLSSAVRDFILLYGNYPSHAALYSQTRQSTPLSTEVWALSQPSPSWHLACLTKACVTRRKAKLPASNTFMIHVLHVEQQRCTWQWQPDLMPLWAFDMISNMLYDAHLNLF